jgi:hypothetical protein
MQKQFGLQFHYEKIFVGPSIKPYIDTVQGWVNCTDEEEKVLAGIPTQVYTKNGKVTYSNHGFGVAESTYGDYLLKMLEAVRNGVHLTIEADSSDSIER